MATLADKYLPDGDPKKYLYLDPRVCRVSRLQRRIHSWARVLAPFLENIGRKKQHRLVMMTLTYTGFNLETGELLPNYGWEAGHIRDFMRTVRRNLNRRVQVNGVRHVEKNLLGYAWVAELQERGAVHYHVLLLVKRGTKIPKPDLAGWWVHGSTNIVTAKSPYYVVKYTSKGLYQEEHGEHKVFPKGLRAFAVWVDDSVIDDLSMWEHKLTVSPGWLREFIAAFRSDYEGVIPRRREGGGWVLYGKFGEELVTGPWEFSTVDRLPDCYIDLWLRPVHEAKMRKGIRCLDENGDLLRDENGDYIYKAL